MDIKQAIQNMLENDLEGMREAFNNVLAEKAVEKLDEKKIHIAQNIFEKIGFSE